MARTDAGSLLTERHRDRQVRLRAATIEELVAIWPAWSVDNPGSFDSFAEAAAVVTRSSASRSAEVAGGYYEAFRTAEGADGRPATRLAEPPDRARTLIALRATGLDGTVRALRAGRSMDAARDIGFTRVAGAVGRLALDGGNRTVLGSVSADRQARGWARVTSGDPCAFCAMLAGRGGVYRSEGTAGFQAHNHCACTVEPSYTGRVEHMPERNQQFRQMWREAQSQPAPPGMNSDALNKFRRHFEAA